MVYRVLRTGLALILVGLIGIAAPPVAAAECSGHTITITGSGFIYGTAGDDVIQGSTRRDVIVGNGGNDVVCPTDGNDDITLGSGNDVAYGGNGRDTIRGGGGNDWIYGGAGPDSLAGQDGFDSIWGDLFSEAADHGIDKITGGSERDQCCRINRHGAWFGVLSRMLGAKQSHSRRGGGQSPTEPAARPR